MQPRFKARGIPYDVFATEDPGVVAVVADPETSPVAYLLATKDRYAAEEVASFEVDLETVARMVQAPEGKRTHKAWCWCCKYFAH